MDLKSMGFENPINVNQWSTEMGKHYKIADKSRGYGVQDQVYETLEQAKRAAVLRSAYTGDEVVVYEVINNRWSRKF
jgi:hypothetical protein